MTTECVLQAHFSLSDNNHDDDHHHPMTSSSANSILYTPCLKYLVASSLIGCSLGPSRQPQGQATLYIPPQFILPIKMT